LFGCLSELRIENFVHRSLDRNLKGNQIPKQKRKSNQVLTNFFLSNPVLDLDLAGARRSPELDDRGGGEVLSRRRRPPNLAGACRPRQGGAPRGRNGDRRPGSLHAGGTETDGQRACTREERRPATTREEQRLAATREERRPATTREERRPAAARQISPPPRGACTPVANRWSCGLGSES
jgi:hypothetical protein